MNPRRTEERKAAARRAMLGLNPISKRKLGEDGRAAFVRGLEGLLRYIDADGTIHGTCEGCLNPGDGSIMAYLGKHAVINDLHAFGPVILAFGVWWITRNPSILGLRSVVYLKL